MAISALFDTPFRTAVGTSNDVPSRFPVAIAGHPYLIDIRRYSRDTLPVIRQQADNAGEPSEATLNPESMWRRTQTDWFHGAGQVFYDGKDSERTRFRTSKGVDNWTRGQISLLNDTGNRRASANTNLKVLTVGSYLYVADGQSLVRTADPTVSSPTWTAITGLPAEAIADMCTDGVSVYLAYAAAGVYSSAVSGTTGALLQANACTKIAFANGRLLAANGAEVFEQTFTPSKVSVVIHPNASFVWTGMAGGPAAIYLFGAVNNLGQIFRTANVLTTGALTAPIFAGYLPPGETLQSLIYDGVFIGGTSKGLRLANADTAGNLSFAPLIATSSPVGALEIQDRFCWFAATNYDGTSTGLYRADPSIFTTGAYIPAYATDLMATTQGSVLSIATFAGKRYFAVSGVGVFGEEAFRVASGTLETGKFRWATSESKTARAMLLRHHSLPTGASVAMQIKADDSTYGAAQSSSSAGTSGPPGYFSFSDLPGETFEVKLTLTRGTTTSTSPEVVSWTVRSVPTPSRDESVTLPIILKDKVSDLSGGDKSYDVVEEETFLRNLLIAGTVVPYQELSFPPESVQVVGIRRDGSLSQWGIAGVDSFTDQNKGFNGTLLVTLQTVRA